MELQPRKRSASVISEERNMRMRIGVESNVAKPNLETLPCEIRLQILEHLLVSRSPLKGRPFVDIHPAILRTCKTFAEDHKRTPLLYMNKFVFSSSIADYDEEMRFLGYAAYSDLLVRCSPYIPATLLQRVRNIIVTIDIDYVKGAGPPTEKDYSNQLRLPMELVKSLKVFGALQTLEIHVNNIPGLDDDKESGNDILGCFQELRGLKSVVVRGTSSKHATEVKTVMESSEPSVPLQAMGDALWRYLIEEFSNDDNGDDDDEVFEVYFFEAALALASYDVDEFIRQREKLVKSIKDEHDARLQDLYQYDMLNAEKAG